MRINLSGLPIDAQAALHDMLSELSDDGADTERAAALGIQFVLETIRPHLPYRCQAPLYTGLKSLLDDHGRPLR